MGGSTFGEEDFGYKAFRKAFYGLIRLGFIHTRPGKKGGRGGEGTATRMRATAKLIELAAEFGVALNELASHYAAAPPPMKVREPIIVREPSFINKKGKRQQGAKLKIDESHIGISLDAICINRLNAYMATKNVTVAKRWTFQRIYCDTGDPTKYARYGGRIYSPFQNMEKAERRTIRIEGEDTGEVDLGSAFLTIYHSIMNQPLDTSVADLYAMSWPRREIAKAYINASFGNGKAVGRWPDEVVDGLENPKDKDVAPIPNIRAKYPLERVRMAVEAKFPLLRQLEESRIEWGDLHYAESEVIIQVLMQLAFEHGVPALPMHDALIVPVSKLTLAKRLLIAEFERQIGVKPQVKIKTFGKEGKLAA